MIFISLSPAGSALLEMFSAKCLRSLSSLMRFWNIITAVIEIQKKNTQKIKRDETILDTSNERLV
jgi:hypothetical protein